MPDQPALVNLASDNWSSAHPEVIEAVAVANEGDSQAYGGDEWTAEAVQALRNEFGSDVQAYFTFNGTGANTVGLAAIVDAHEAVVCSQFAHVITDEAGAIHRFAGCGVVPVPAPDGRLSISVLERALEAFARGEHQSRPAVVSIANSTELGTDYSAVRLRELADWAHERDLLLHMDGARLANAAAHHGTSLATLSLDAGVDVLSLGGTKNGLLYGEAVLLSGDALDDRGAARFRHIRKQAGQLASKQRFISAQFSAYLKDELWRRNAAQANDMARRLAGGLEQVGIELAFPVHGNMVFARIPTAVREQLGRVARFHDWDPRNELCRLVCSFDTAADDIDAVVAAAGKAADCT